MIRTNVTAFSRCAGFEARRHSMFRCLRPYLDTLEDRRLMTASLVASGNVINPGPVEGAAFTAVIAKFTDSDGSTDPSNFAALINWGDGQVTKGTIATDPAGGFDITGTHTFAQSRALKVTALVGDKDGDSAATTTTNIVAQADHRNRCGHQGQKAKELEERDRRNLHRRGFQPAGIGLYRPDPLG